MSISNLFILTISLSSNLSTPPMEPYEQGVVIHVDDDAPFGGDGASWATAFKFLQDGLDAGTTLHIAGGVYYPDRSEANPEWLNDRSKVFDLRNKVIIGGFAGLENPSAPNEIDTTNYTTIFSGDLSANDGGTLDPSNINPSGLTPPSLTDNSDRVCEANSGTELTGIKITGGYSHTQGLGGGIYCEDHTGTLLLTNCQIVGNYAEFGGGLCSTVEVVATDCTFSNNAATVSGGALYLDYVTACDYGELIVECDGEGNCWEYWTGCKSACCWLVGTHNKFNRSSFQNNHSLMGSGGAIASDGVDTSLYNCLLDSNFSAIDGAGIAFYNYEGPNPCDGWFQSDWQEQDLTIIHCTFKDNQALGNGANVYLQNSGAGLRIENSVLWGSSPILDHIVFPDIYTGCWSSSQAPTYSYKNNLIEGAIAGPLGAGSGIYNIDPQFIDSKGRIDESSPCFDNGLLLNMPNSSYNLDLDGLPRVSGPLPDIGAYEVQLDCNGNGIPDAIDLNLGTSADCNFNYSPDECDIADGVSGDCNNNSLPDDCDLDANDCNFNSIPDECDVATSDCNETGVPDDCELIGQDCNINGVPDDCDLLIFDCNLNSVVDECDIDNATSDDCDQNLVPDECEIETNDCNSNGTLDACDILSGVFNDCDGNFTPDECELAGNDCDANGTPDQCDAVGIDCNSNSVPDYCELSGNDCDNNTVPDDCQSDCNGDLVPDACEPDCDGDGIPNWCETAPEEGDCNANGLPDNCDIAAGTSTDLNHNLSPDECDPDCNENNLPDFIDIAYGVSPDCNSNEIPDECDVNSGTSNDCNGNGVPDECDTSDASSMDCNSNSIPDECEDDCNQNGVPDDCDIASGTSLDLNEDGYPDDCKPDCNGNGVPDYIDILFSVSQDCDLNGIPDECEADCNDNGVLDLCDLSAGTSSDCDANSIPDECDPDCDQDGTPDNCQSFTDCNANGSPDGCDILTQESDDCDGNNIPDECDLAAGADDCDENGSLDICQIAADPNADLNGNGTLDTCECFATNFCESVVNSSGSAGSIGITGSTILSQNDLTLTSTGVPANQFGVFYYGPNQVNGGAGTPFGEGKRCVGGQTVRLNVTNTGPDGFAQATIDNTTLPHSQNLQPGSTWHFQFWFRDPSGGPFGWNLTDALSITFCP